MPMKRICPSGVTRLYRLCSPIGDLEVESCLQGIHTLKQSGETTNQEFKPMLSQRVQMVKGEEEAFPPVLQTVDWLQCYFQEGQRVKSIATPSICHLMSPPGDFNHTVWKTLLEEVPFGKSVSYGELAKMCNNPRASQAVGNAMRNNPVSFIVPCHRVILSSGRSGNYSGGKKNSLKVWLLQHEGSLV